MEEVSDGMMPLGGRATRRIDMQLEFRSRFGRVIVREKMEECIADFLRIGDVPDCFAGLGFPSVADLPAHFGVKRRNVQCHGQFIL